MLGLVGTGSGRVAAAAVIPCGGAAVVGLPGCSGSFLNPNTNTSRKLPLPDHVQWQCSRMASSRAANQLRNRQEDYYRVLGVQRTATQKEVGSQDT